MYEEDEGGATQVYNPDDPVMGVEWSVNVSDEETRTMRAAEIAFEFLRGTLHAEDTFVWRDGLDDWLPLGQCQELQEIIRQYASGQPSHDPHAHGPAEDDFGSTVMMDTGGDAAPTPAYQQPAVRHEVSRTLASPFDSAPAAASSYGGDPFASLQPGPASEPPHSRRLGERNEASSLFSLKDLALPSSAPAPRRERDPLEDLMNLGDGGGGIASAFAPPPIHAPAPPPPPPPPVVQVVQASAPPPAMSLPPAMMMQMQQPKRGAPLGLIIGASLGALAVIGLVLAFALSGGDETTANNESAESAETAADEAEKSEDKADQDDKSEDAADETAKNDEDKGDEESDNGEKKPDDKAEDKTASVTPTKTTDGKVDSSSKDDKKKEEKKEAKSETKTEDKPEEKKGGKGEFNRDAARSALAGAAGAASGCAKPGGPTGRGRVTVTFAPSGRATTASVGAPFAGTAVGSCAAGAFKSASVPPFDGGAVTVSKSFFIK